MSEVCREFGIFSLDRLQNPQSLQTARSGRIADRSRRPVRYANQLPPQIEALIVRTSAKSPVASPDVA